MGPDEPWVPSSQTFYVSISTLFSSVFSDPLPVVPPLRIDPYPEQDLALSHKGRGKGRSLMGWGDVGAIRWGEHWGAVCI